MARQTLLITTVFAIALMTLPALGKDDKDTNPKPKPQPAKQPEIQLRVQPGAFVIRGALNNPLNLVRNAKVQEELKLDDDQKAKIQEAVQAANAQRQEMFAALRGLQGDERQKKVAELQKKVQEKTAEATKVVRAALKPEQAERLDQISLQTRGIQALSDAKVAEKLQLTDEQKKQIQDTAAAGRQKRTQLGQDVRNGNVERAKYREKLQAITKETETKTTDVLTDEQKAQFAKMKICSDHCSHIRNMGSHFGSLRDDGDIDIANAIPLIGHQRNDVTQQHTAVCPLPLFIGIREMLTDIAQSCSPQ